MKKLLVACLVAFTTIAKAQNLSLSVSIKQFKNSNGMAHITLQDPTKKLLQQQWVRIEKNEAIVVFKNLKPGKYAVRLYHDENNNKKLDTGLFDMPKEGWGCSNDVKPNFAAPKFEDMLFSLEKDQIISITMN